MNTIEIKNYEFMGYNLIYNNDMWTISETKESFKTAQDAENYIRNGMRKTSEAQRKAIREYESKNDRINVVFPSGTRKRMEKLGIKSMGAFIKEAVEKELSSMEKYLK